MNRSIIIYMLGWIMNMEAIFMTLPVITAVIYRESIGFIYLGVAAVCGLLGFLCTRKKPCTKMFFAREGFVTVSYTHLDVYKRQLYRRGGEHDK